MNNIFLDYNDVLINPGPSKKALTRKMVDIKMDLGFDKIIPIVIANMLSLGTYKIANIMAEHNILVFLHKEYTAAEHIKMYNTLTTPRLVGITSGVQQWDKEKTIEVCSQVKYGYINVDIANVYANVSGIVETIKLYKETFPNIPVVAGNICNTLVLDELVDAGADFIKVGVGPGAACKTRSEIGVGVPQFSAVLEVAAAAKKLGVKVIADGGCVTSGDVCKAIAAGADIVMIGGMVSKSEECDNIVEINGKKYVNFFGLGSNKQYSLTGPTEQEYRPNEGRDLLIPVQGSIVDVTNQIKGALRSVCTYVGVDNINDLHTNAEFIRVNNIINKSLEKYET
jgi:GMP reductase